jgi:ABC-type multidrug transport system permease subunit
MLFTISADIVVVIHFLWIVFIIGGFPFFLYVNSTVGRVLHLIALVITVGMQITGTICPLTYLEAFLKSKGGDFSVHPWSFISGALESLIYVDHSTLEIISWMTLAFLVVVVLSFKLRPLRTKGKTSNSSNHESREVE